MSRRKPADDVDRVGMAVLSLMAEGAKGVYVERKGSGPSYRYKVTAVVKRKARKARL